MGPSNSRFDTVGEVTDGAHATSSSLSDVALLSLSDPLEYRIAASSASGTPPYAQAFMNLCPALLILALLLLRPSLSMSGNSSRLTGPTAVSLAVYVADGYMGCESRVCGEKGSGGYRYTLLPREEEVTKRRPRMFSAILLTCGVIVAILHYPSMDGSEWLDLHGSQPFHPSMTRSKDDHVTVGSNNESLTSHHQHGNLAEVLIDAVESSQLSPWRTYKKVANHPHSTHAMTAISSASSSGSDGGSEDESAVTEEEYDEDRQYDVGKFKCWQWTGKYGVQRN